MGDIKYVLLTGATGFIGGHVLDELLSRGLKVRCSARSHKKADQMMRDRSKHVHDGRLEFVFVQDLTLPGVFDDAVKGVDAIVHTASPVYYDITSNEKELMLPAITGTTSILSAALKEPRIKRIVLTSSFAAVVDRGRGPWPGHTYTAMDWNPITYSEGVVGDPIAGYRAGKKFAEQTAWDIVNATPKPSFDLVTFCPPMVFGPVVHPVERVGDLNDSNSLLYSMTQPGKPLPTPRVPCWVDVRDLARAHAEGLLRPEVGNHRYTIAAPDHFTYQRAADIVRATFPWAKTIVTRGNEGEPMPDSFYVDGDAAARDLGITYRSFKETVLDAVAQFREIQLHEE